MRSVSLTTEAFPASAGLDTGISHAVLRAVGRGEIGETFRLHGAVPLVAFGRLDRLTPGYHRAVTEARDAGFEAVERLAGGRAAVFHEGTLAFSWASRTPDPRAGIHERFETLSQIVFEAFQAIGIDARVGEVPGEYCPGAFSVNARGAVKLMGVGQRLIRNAAHVGGVIVVSGGIRIRNVLAPVYDALGLDWDPATVGDIAGEVGEIGMDDVAAVFVAALGRRFDVVGTTLPTDVIDEGASLAPDHVVTEPRKVDRPS